METFFGFDEESVDSETLSETSCNTDRTDRAPATPEEDLDDVSGLGVSGLRRWREPLPRLEIWPPEDLWHHGPWRQGEGSPPSWGPRMAAGHSSTRGRSPLPRADDTEEIRGHLGVTGALQLKLLPGGRPLLPPKHTQTHTRTRVCAHTHTHPS